MGHPGEVLAPLRARYGRWLTLDPEEVRADRDEPPSEIRAMQLIVRMERDQPPSFFTAVALAARASAVICLDPRSAAGGEWFDLVSAYCAGHIRKVTRRGRGAQWEATADLPGVTLRVGVTEVRALVPGRVVELDKRVAKLQVGGTDVPRDDETVRVTDRGQLEVFLPPSVPMTLGKAMAQAGHAGMIAAAMMAGESALDRWIEAGLPAGSRVATGEQWSELSAATQDPEAGWLNRRLVVVRDAGFTEVDPGTITAIASVPA